MTPQEHYDRAEELVRKVRLYNGRPMYGEGANRDTVALAAVHAKLAEVGLLLQRDEEAPYAYDSNKDHDFPMSAPKSTAFCQKCGRCWDHQGAECAGGQEHSTAKACLVCVGVGGR